MFTPDADIYLNDQLVSVELKNTVTHTVHRCAALGTDTSSSRLMRVLTVNDELTSSLFRVTATTNTRQSSDSCQPTKCTSWQLLNTALSCCKENSRLTMHRVWTDNELIDRTWKEHPSQCRCMEQMDCQICYSWEKLRISDTDTSL